MTTPLDLDPQQIIAAVAAATSQTLTPVTMTPAPGGGRLDAFNAQASTAWSQLDAEATRHLNERARELNAGTRQGMARVGEMNDANRISLTL